jgi:aminoglycoside phosphotransferase
MNATGAAWLRTPPGLVRSFADWQWKLAWQYPGHSVVYRLRRPDHEARFLKLAPAGRHPSLSAEADRMRWASSYLAVPQVIDLGTDSGVEWMVTSLMPGKDGTDPAHLSNLERLVRALGHGLRRFHDACSVPHCPFDFRLDAALAHARQRVSAGRVEPARDFDPSFKHLSASQAISVLDSTRPDSEDLVVCHGDYCPPNILIEDWVATGFIDLGELGVADRWCDLAVATRSMTNNFGPGYEDVFLAEYGAAPDQERMVYYRLLHDVVS